MTLRACREICPRVKLLCLAVFEILLNIVSLRNRTPSKTLSHLWVCVSHWISGHLPQLALSAPQKTTPPPKSAMDTTVKQEKSYAYMFWTYYRQHVEFECASFKSNSKTSREDQCSNYWCLIQMLYKPSIQTIESICTNLLPFAHPTVRILIRLSSFVGQVQQLVSKLNSEPAD